MMLVTPSSSQQISRKNKKVSSPFSFSRDPPTQIRTNGRNSNRSKAAASKQATTHNSNSIKGSTAPRLREDEQISLDLPLGERNFNQKSLRRSDEIKCTDTAESGSAAAISQQNESGKVSVDISTERQQAKEFYANLMADPYVGSLYLKRPKTNDGTSYKKTGVSGRLIHKGRPQTQSIANNPRQRRTEPNTVRRDRIKELQMSQVASSATLQKRPKAAVNSDLSRGLAFAKGFIVRKRSSANIGVNGRKKQQMKPVQYKDSNAPCLATMFKASDFYPSDNSCDRRNSQELDGSARSQCIEQHQLNKMQRKCESEIQLQKIQQQGRKLRANFRAQLARDHFKEIKEIILSRGSSKDSFGPDRNFKSNLANPISQSCEKVNKIRNAYPPPNDAKSNHSRSSNSRNGSSQLRQRSRDLQRSQSKQQVDPSLSYSNSFHMFDEQQVFSFDRRKASMDDQRNSVYFEATESRAQSPTRTVGPDDWKQKHVVLKKTTIKQITRPLFQNALASAKKLSQVGRNSSNSKSAHKLNNLATENIYAAKPFIKPSHHLNQQQQPQLRTAPKSNNLQQQDSIDRRSQDCFSLQDDRESAGSQDRQLLDLARLEKSKLKIRQSLQHFRRNVLASRTEGVQPSRAYMPQSSGAGVTLVAISNSKGDLMLPRQNHLTRDDLRALRSFDGVEQATLQNDASELNNNQIWKSIGSNMSTGSVIVIGSGERSTSVSKLAQKPGMRNMTATAIASTTQQQSQQKQSLKSLSFINRLMSSKQRMTAVDPQHLHQQIQLQQKLRGRAVRMPTSKQQVRSTIVQHQVTTREESQKDRVRFSSSKFI